ncbi:MAG: HAD family hydrolase [Mesorhizobium sp.]
MARNLTTIGFDADDTLWQNEQFFVQTRQRYFDLVKDHADAQMLAQKLDETERRMLATYGFGAKGFILSMIETAISVTDGKIPSQTVARILETGREMLTHPVELLPHAREAVEALVGRYRLVLVTKGDLFHQESKLAASGLGELFDGIEIVSDKNRATYQRVFSRHGDGAERAMMIGNSLKSDILPAIEAGGWGVFVPHDLTWAVEHADEPQDNPRFRKIATLASLPRIIDEIG